MVLLYLGACSPPASSSPGSTSMEWLPITLGSLTPFHQTGPEPGARLLVMERPRPFCRQRGGTKRCLKRNALKIDFAGKRPCFGRKEYSAQKWRKSGGKLPAGETARRITPAPGRALTAALPGPFCFAKCLHQGFCGGSSIRALPSAEARLKAFLVGFAILWKCEKVSTVRCVCTPISALWRCAKF